MRQLLQRPRPARVIALGALMLGLAGCGDGAGSGDASTGATPAPKGVSAAQLQAAPQFTAPDVTAYRDCEPAQISARKELSDAAKAGESSRLAVACKAGSLTLHAFDDADAAMGEFGRTSGQPKGANTPETAPEGTICATDDKTFTCMRTDGTFLLVATAATAADDAAAGLVGLTDWAKPLAG